MARNTAAQEHVSNSFFHITMAGCILVIFCVSLALLKLTDTTLVWSQLWTKVDAGAFGYLIGLFLIILGRLRRSHWLRDAGLIVIWTRLLDIVLLLPVFAAGRLHFPLQDRTLGAIDERLLLTVPMVISWVGKYSWLRILLARSYSTLALFTIIGVILPLLLNRIQAAKELLLSSAVALLITSGIFAVIPAIGPWTVYPLEEKPLHTLCTNTIMTLRHAGPQVLDLLGYSGIISFPSFHVILAVLSAIAIARCARWAAIPAAIWAALIVISTVSIGWHYVVDVWGGLVFTVFCVAVARSFTLLERRIAGPSGVPDEEPGERAALAAGDPDFAEKQSPF
jgi:membrane-associated phospholipid phosphatase